LHISKDKLASSPGCNEVNKCLNGARELVRFLGGTKGPTEFGDSRRRPERFHQIGIRKNHVWVIVIDRRIFQIQRDDEGIGN